MPFIASLGDGPSGATVDSLHSGVRSSSHSARTDIHFHDLLQAKGGRLRNGVTALATHSRHDRVEGKPGLLVGTWQIVTSRPLDPRRAYL